MPKPQHVLTTTTWLANHLYDADLRVVDIRGHVLPPDQPPPHYFNHRSDYDQAHIPGAVFVDWVHEITDPADPRHARIAPPERFAAAMSRLGIGPDTHVVAYDDAGGLFASRLWWSLNYYGHAAVQVLNGGWTKWIAEGRITTAEVPSIPPANFSARPDPEWIRTGAQVLAALGGSVQLVDMRSAAEFRGEQSRAARKGHIPGAVNQPRSDLIQPSGELLSSEEVRARFAAQGVDEHTEEVIFYCNAGVSASFGLLAMRAAGLNPRASVYDGSWKDWGNDPTKPIQ